MELTNAFTETHRGVGSNVTEGECREWTFGESRAMERGALCRKPRLAAVALMHEAKHRPSNKLSVIVDAARYQSSNLQDEFGPETVSIFFIERIGLTAYNGPGGFEHGRERNIVKFSLPKSSHVALSLRLGAFPR